MTLRCSMKVAICTPVWKSSPCSASQFLYTVPELPGTRSTQAGRGMILPACQVYDAGERVWAPAASVLVVPHVLIDPSTRTPDQHPLTHTQLGRTINGTRVPEKLEVTARHLSEAPPGQDLPLWPQTLPDS